MEEACYVFEFVYDGEKEYGVTGPITFSIDADLEEGETYSDLLKKYENWYVGEEVKELTEQALQEGE